MTHAHGHKSRMDVPNAGEWTNEPPARKIEHSNGLGNEGAGDGKDVQ